MKDSRLFTTLSRTMEAETSISTLPILVGRFTPKRRAIAQAYIDGLNEDMKAPYGISPNGYAYRCGCERDCCGCLVRRFYTPVYIGNPDGHCALHLELTEIFNY